MIKASEKYGKYIQISDTNTNAIPKIHGVRVSPTFDSIIKRHIEIDISRKGELLSKLDLSIEPTNFPIDQTLRYHYFANEVLEQKILLPNINPVNLNSVNLNDKVIYYYYYIK